MKENRLGILQRYIEEQGLDQVRNNAILADFSGRIISLAGFSFNLGLVKPVIGSLMSDFHPVFEGIFPFHEDFLIIPNIETQPGIFWDIHILQGNKLCWIIFEEKTDVVEKFRPGLQLRNEENLLKETRYDSGSEISKIAGALDYLILKYRLAGEWEFIGTPPFWFSDFFEKGSKYLNYNQLSSVFPFLESFLEEVSLNKTFNQISGIWSETRGRVNYHFRAQIIEDSPSKYLLIKKLHPEFEVNQELMQHARNHVLAYEELKKSANLIFKLNKVRDQFISIISHDLRSPFISIISAMDYLFGDPLFTDGLQEEHREFLEYIHEDSKRVLDYVEKLLDWTRLDSGKLQPALQTVELEALMKLSRTQFDQRLKDKEIQFHINIHQGFQFEADPTLFSQVINNLIGNSIKFTPRGGTISLETRITEKRREIVIKDTGIGIPPEKLNSLFKEYEKHYTYGTEGEKGSGLGLSITKKILDVHHYSISCNSKLEKGTEFIIVL